MITNEQIKIAHAIKTCANKKERMRLARMIGNIFAADIGKFDQFDREVFELACGITELQTTKVSNLKRITK